MIIKPIRFEHPGQPNMFAEVVLASRHPVTGVEVFTLHLRYPRIVHGEVMTHRVFNRNARSSRAVPIKTLLAEIRNAPFVPWHWGKNQSGMQASEECNEMITGSMCHLDMIDNCFDPVSRETGWLWARDQAVEAATAFDKAGYHKQVVNRLVETWMWMDLLVTATDWKNFIHLRDHEAAEPHIRDLAVLVGKALYHAEVQNLKIGEWHLPYINENDRQWASDLHYEETPLSINEVLCQVSAARCARISYKPFDGNSTYEKELERFNMLVGGDAVHASPLEHQCSPDDTAIVETTRWSVAGEMMRDDSTEGYMHDHLHASLRGFIQFRKTVPNEAFRE